VNDIFRGKMKVFVFAVLAAAVELLRVPSTAALCAPSRPELAAALVSGPRPDGLAELSADLPHRWEDSELEELQWPPLVDAARELRGSLVAKTEEEVWAHDLVSAHALDLDGSVWLVPALARFGRSAPEGAQLARCDATGDLLLTDTSGGRRDARRDDVRDPPPTGETNPVCETAQQNYYSLVTWLVNHWASTHPARPVNSSRGQ